MYRFCWVIGYLHPASRRVERVTRMSQLLSTKEVARFLGVNEKMVYTLVAEKSLPATKITGKWLFPKHLVEQWIEANTINYPDPPRHLPPYEGLLIVAGSNDPLLEKTLALFNRRYPDHVADLGNLGSLGGLLSLIHISEPTRHTSQTRNHSSR